jgi:hypothetical protein
MSKSIIVFTAISGDKMHSDFMQACDVFEKSKVLGELQKITITVKDDVVISEEYVRAVMANTIAAMNHAKRVLSFLHFEYYEQNDTTISNSGSITPYVNKEVRMISNGHNFFLLDEFIRRSTGLKVITDEHRFVQAVGVAVENEGLRKTQETKD